LRLLILDDHRAVRSSIRRLLRGVAGLEILEAGTVAEALAAANEGLDLMLVDIRLSDDPRDRGGLEVMRELQRTGKNIPAVIVSTSSAVSDLREAMKLGARDYILKDELCPELVVPIVESFREKMALHGEVQRLRARVERDWGPGALVGSSVPMERLRKSIDRVAQADAPVLILGETGVGKEMVARAIHQASGRRDEPFIAINCTAIPGTLLESLLFGHEKGAFTGADRRRKGRLAAAEAGTVLLDEIGHMPLDVQAKLLRVLEEQKFLPVGAEEEVPLRARVLAATNVDLGKSVQQGEFRSDLFYRLDVVTLRVPSLAERGPTDFTELVDAFNEEFPRKLRFTGRAIAWLQRRAWQGNIRELKNVLRRLSILSESEEIDLPELEEIVSDRAAPTTLGSFDALVDALLAAPDVGPSKYHAIERALLRRALDLSNGNHSAAARMLGMERRALTRRWERLASGDDGDD